MLIVYEIAIETTLRSEVLGEFIFTIIYKEFYSATQQINLLKIPYL
jgi:hypothetical protein